MEPFFFKIGKDVPIMAVPDTRVQMDGHPVITRAYNIYEDTTADNPTALLADDDLYLKKHINPNYLGTIIFEIPGRVFN